MSGAATAGRRLIAAAALAVLGVSPAGAAGPLIADLSSKEIRITTGFAGTALLLFGALDAAGDVVVVVRGPRRREVVRRKVRVAGVWVNGDSMAFDGAPAFYRIASTRPLAALAPAALLAERQLGAGRLRFQRGPGARAGDVAEFRRALLRNKRRSGLYSDGEGAVAVVGDRLFRTTVVFPANVPTGTYSVDTYLFRGGRLVDAQSTPLAVHKAGLEADIFDFAHRHSAAYGVIAIVIALVAGWLAGVMFRRS